MTGSSTTTGGRTRSSHAPTARMTSASASIPIFTASITMSSDTASSCARRKSTGGTCTARTPCVFCAVSAVSTAIPYPPFAAMDLRSAWMPAPPDGSLPAMLSTRGTMPERQRRRNRVATAAGSSAAHNAETTASPDAPASRRDSVSSMPTPPIATHGSGLFRTMSRKPSTPSGTG